VTFLRQDVKGSRPSRGHRGGFPNFQNRQRKVDALHSLTGVLPRQERHYGLNNDDNSLFL
jgi:hypothetical protein